MVGNERHRGIVGTIIFLLMRFQFYVWRSKRSFWALNHLFVELFQCCIDASYPEMYNGRHYELLMIMHRTLGGDASISFFKAPLPKPIERIESYRTIRYGIPRAYFTRISSVWKALGFGQNDSDDEESGTESTSMNSENSEDDDEKEAGMGTAPCKRLPPPRLVRP